MAKALAAKDAVSTRMRSIRRVLWIVLVLNLAVAAAKYVYGTVTGSASMQADGIHINAGQPRIIRQLKDLEVVLVLAARVQMGQHIMIIVVLGMVGCMVRQLQFLFTEHDRLTVLTVLE